MFSTVIDFFRWTFSNSGVLRGSRGKKYIDSTAMATFAMGKHPLVMKTCSYCGSIYWAFMDSNTYCGQFACFRRAREA